MHHCLHSNQICASSIFGTYRFSSLAFWYAPNVILILYYKQNQKIKSSGSFKLCINIFFACTKEERWMHMRNVGFSHVDFKWKVSMNNKNPDSMINRSKNACQKCCRGENRNRKTNVMLMYDWCIFLYDISRSPFSHKQIVYKQTNATCTK